jgi:hypothetical protein
MLLIVLYSSNADDNLFFRQPIELRTYKDKINIIWQNDYNLPLDLFYKTDSEWIKIDSNNTKNHYNNFVFPITDSIWFKIEINISTPSQENYYQDFISIDNSEIRGISVADGQPWFITKNNYLYNLTTNQMITLPEAHKSAYGMVSRNNNLIFAQNNELWSFNVATRGLNLLTNMSNLSKNLYIINDTLLIGGFNFLGFYNFNNSSYQEFKFSGQIYDIKKVNNKIYVASDRTVYTLDENFSVINSLTFPYTIGAIGIIDDVIIVGEIGKTLAFVKDGLIFNTVEFGNGGIIDIEIFNSSAFVASRDGSIRQFYKNGNEFCSLQNLTAISEITLNGNELLYGTRDGFVGSFNYCQRQYVADSILIFIEKPPAITSVKNEIELIDDFIERNSSKDKVEIWTLDGKLIFTGFLREFKQISASGIYFIRINDKFSSFVLVN